MRALGAAAATTCALCVALCAISAQAFLAAGGRILVQRSSAATVAALRPAQASHRCRVRQLHSSSLDAADGVEFGEFHLEGQAAQAPAGGEQLWQEPPAVSESGQAGDTYIKCGRCSAIYLIGLETLGERGRRVACSVCDHSWYQSPDRVFRLGPGMSTQDFPEERITEVREGLKQGIGAGTPGRKGEMTLFCGNLPFSVTEQSLAGLFAPHGAVVSAVVVRDNTGRSKGFGFVEMVKRDEGEAARTALNGLEVDGRAIAVRDGNAPRT